MCCGYRQTLLCFASIWVFGIELWSGCVAGTLPTEPSPHHCLVIFLCGNLNMKIWIYLETEILLELHCPVS